jgi:class 3 adenylate cyclase
MPLLRISVSVAIVLIALSAYAVSLGVWIATLQSGQTGVRNIANTYVAGTIDATRDQLDTYLGVSEKVTAMNARMFATGAYAIPDRADARGAEVDKFLQGFRATLYGFMHVTTVSMTDYRGALFGVYNNFDFSVAGQWQQYQDTATGNLVLLDYETYPRDDPREGQVKALIGLTEPYNSSEQVWYTVCDTRVNTSNAWTPMYTMGNVGTVTTMLSQSHVARRADGSLVGVMSIDMATGFVGKTLSSFSETAAFTFAVDSLADALLGTSAGDEIMECTTGGSVSGCAVDKQGFRPPSRSTNPLVVEVTKHVLSRSGGNWRNVDRLDFKSGSLMISARVIRRNNLQWAVVMVLDEDVILSDVKRTQTNMIVIQVVCGVAQLLGCAIFAYAIVRPLRDVANKMEAVTALDGKVIDEAAKPITESGLVLAEISKVRQSFHLMASSLKWFLLYLPSDVVKQLMADRFAGTSGLVERRLTILFSDIRNFTNATAALRSQAAIFVDLLQLYFEHTTTALTEEGCTIDKFIGDAIMGFWGAPFHCDNQVEHGCIGALRMQSVVASIAPRFAEHGWDLAVRVGLHAGDTMVGSIGSQRRLNYTALGDPVNMASRLEGLCKYLGCEIAVSAAISTEAEVLNKFVLRRRGRFMLKGADTPLLVSELVGMKARAYDNANLPRLAPSHEPALVDMSRRRVTVFRPTLCLAPKYRVVEPAEEHVMAFNSCQELYDEGKPHHAQRCARDLRDRLDENCLLEESDIVLTAGDVKSFELSCQSAIDLGAKFSAVTVLVNK